MRTYTYSCSFTYKKIILYRYAAYFLSIAREFLTMASPNKTNSFFVLTWHTFLFFFWQIFCFPLNLCSSHTNIHSSTYKYRRDSLPRTCWCQKRMKTHERTPVPIAIIDTPWTRGWYCANTLLVLIVPFPWGTNWFWKFSLLLLLSTTFFLSNKPASTPCSSTSVKVLLTQSCVRCRLCVKGAVVIIPKGVGDGMGARTIAAGDTKSDVWLTGSFGSASWVGKNNTRSAAGDFGATIFGDRVYGEVEDNVGSGARVGSENGTLDENKIAVGKNIGGSSDAAGLVDGNGCSVSLDANFTVSVGSEDGASDGCRTAVGKDEDGESDGIGNEVYATLVDGNGFSLDKKLNDAVCVGSEDGALDGNRSAVWEDEDGARDNIGNLPASSLVCRKGFGAELDESWKVTVLVGIEDGSLDGSGSAVGMDEDDTRRDKGTVDWKLWNGLSDALDGIEGSGLSLSGSRSDTVNFGVSGWGAFDHASSEGYFDGFWNFGAGFVSWLDASCALGIKRDFVWFGDSEDKYGKADGSAGPVMGFVNGRMFNAGFLSGLEIGVGAVASGLWTWTVGVGKGWFPSWVPVAITGRFSEVFLENGGVTFAIGIHSLEGRGSGFAAGTPGLLVKVISCVTVDVALAEELIIEALGTGITGFGRGASGLGMGFVGFGAGASGAGRGAIGFGAGASGLGAGTGGVGTGGSGLGAGTGGLGTGGSGFGAGTGGVGTGGSGFGAGTGGLGTGGSGLGAGTGGLGTGGSGLGAGTGGPGTGGTDLGAGTGGLGTGGSGFGAGTGGLGTGGSGFGAGTGGLGTGGSGFGAGTGGLGIGAGWLGIWGWAAPVKGGFVPPLFIACSTPPPAPPFPAPPAPPFAFANDLDLIPFEP
jgi:hypothetical protein